MKLDSQISRRDSLRRLGGGAAFLAARSVRAGGQQSHDSSAEPTGLAEPAPDWLRNAEMVTDWGPGDLTRVQGIPLLINVQQKDWAEKAQAQGFRTITYVGTLDALTGARKDESNAKLLIEPDNANGLLVDQNGRFVNTLMDGTYRLDRMLICANSTTYVRKMLEFMEGLLKLGTDGFFMDNVMERTVECHGEGLRIGYSKAYNTVLSESLPVKFKDPKIGDVPVHKHLYPGQSQSYALRQLLLAVRRLAKSHGTDKVMIINGGLEFADCADGTMLESYICSWAWKGRRQTWPQLKEVARKHAPYIKSGGVVIALSYLGETQTTVKDDAFFCYAAARLSDFIWSDYRTLGDNPATVLYQNHLGSPSTALLAAPEGVEYRWFQKGLIVMNGKDQTAGVNVALPEESGFRSLGDLYEDRDIPVTDHHVGLSVPAQSGRAYSWRAT